MRPQDTVDPSEWDEFVASTTGDTIAQTTSWARTKDSRFVPTMLGVREGSDLVGGCLVMRGRVGPIDVLLAPRGPLLARRSETAAQALLDQILAVATSWRPGVVILQPATATPEVEQAMREAGFTSAPVDIATPATVEISLEREIEDLLAGLRSSRRRNIRKADRAGMIVRRGDHADLSTFHRLHCNTARRQGFTPMSRGYLDRQWEQLGKSDLLSIYLAEVDGVTLSAATVTTFGDRAVFKLAGLSDDPAATDLRSSDFLHWQIMCDSKNRGYRYYDLGGFDKAAAQTIAAGNEPPESIRASASQFKLGFGGQVRVLPEAMWRIGPAVGRPLQKPLTEICNRSHRARSTLMRFRD